MEHIFRINAENFTTLLSTTTSALTTTAASDVVPKYVGFIALAVSVFFLGSNFLVNFNFLKSFTIY
jgi:hypothetical protein